MIKRLHTVIQVHQRLSISFALLLLVVMPSVALSAPSSPPYLAQITIDETTLSPAFRPTTLYYTASVVGSVSNLTLHTTPQDPATTIAITGNDNLHTGSNIITITATADGETATYIITVEKTGEIGSDNANLKSLSIKRWVLTPAYSSEVTTYSIDVEHDVNSLDLEAIAENPKSTVSITGNENFKTGTNQVQILVTSESGAQTRAYMISVNKLPAVVQDVTPIADTTSAAKSHGNKQYVQMIMTGVVILALLTLIAIFLGRQRRRKKNNPTYR